MFRYRFGIQLAYLGAKVSGLNLHILGHRVGIQFAYLRAQGRDSICIFEGIGLVWYFGA